MDNNEKQILVGRVVYRNARAACSQLGIDYTGFGPLVALQTWCNTPSNDPNWINNARVYLSISEDVQMMKPNTKVRNLQKMADLADSMGEDITDGKGNIL